MKRTWLNSRNGLHSSETVLSAHGRPKQGLTINAVGDVCLLPIFVHNSALPLAVHIWHAAAAWVMHAVHPVEGAVPHLQPSHYLQAGKSRWMEHLTCIV